MLLGDGLDEGGARLVAALAACQLAHLPKAPLVEVSTLAERKADFLGGIDVLGGLVVCDGDHRPIELRAKELGGGVVDASLTT